MVVRSVVGQAVDRLSPRAGIALRSRYGGSRETELAILPRYIREGETVIDAGAHRGLYTSLMAQLVGPDGSVHAFEPQAGLGAYLRRGFRQSPQVIVHEQALSDADGTSVLTIPHRSGKEILGHATLEGSPGPGRQFTIETVRLDDLALQPTFMKMDVEGHEANVVTGGLETLRSSRPFLLVEIDRRSTRPTAERERLLRMLEDLDYSPRVVTGDGAQLPFEVGRLSDPLDPIAPDRYAYNFLFVPGS